jgi:hypothetical protein
MTPEITKILQETASLEEELDKKRHQLEKLVSALFMEWLVKGSWSVTARGLLTPKDAETKAALEELASILGDSRWGHYTTTLSNDKGDVFANIYMDDGDLTLSLEGDSLPPEYNVDLKAMLRQQYQEDLEAARKWAAQGAAQVARLIAKLENLQ